MSQKQPPQPKQPPRPQTDTASRRAPSPSPKTYTPNVPEIRAIDRNTSIDIPPPKS